VQELAERLLEDVAPRRLPEFRRGVGLARVVRVWRAPALRDGGLLGHCCPLSRDLCLVAGRGGASDERTRWSRRRGCTRLRVGEPEFPAGTEYAALGGRAAGTPAPGGT